MRYRMIRRENYKKEPVQFAGYYVLKLGELIKEHGLPEPEVFFVEEDDEKQEQSG